jgi:hypothetical protein
MSEVVHLGNALTDSSYNAFNRRESSTAHLPG